MQRLSTTTTTVSHGYHHHHTAPCVCRMTFLALGYERSEIRLQSVWTFLILGTYLKYCVLGVRTLRTLHYCKVLTYYCMYIEIPASGQIASAGDTTYF